MPLRESRPVSLSPDVLFAFKQSIFADIISIRCSPRPGLACPSKVLFTVACIVFSEAACVIRIAKVVIASHAQYSSTGRNLKCWPRLVSFFVIAVKGGIERRGTLRDQ
jgi:hypothetical protein